jgi:hypothetical protein
MKKQCRKPTCECVIEVGEGVMEMPYCSVECERGRPCGHEGCDCKDLNVDEVESKRVTARPS